MLLAIDVGNTNTKFAFFEGDQIVNTFRLTTATPRTSDEFGMTIEGLTGRFGIGKKDIHGIIVSSVVPDIMHALNNSLYRFLGRTPMIVGPGTKTGIRLVKTNPQEGARHWENVKRLVRELRGHEKIYLSADKGAPLIAEPEKIMLSVRTWRMGGKDYILVSSGENREVKYAFSLPQVYRKLKSLSGTCSLGPEGNCLQVRLAPYGMVLAELSVLHSPLSSSKTTKE